MLQAGAGGGLILGASALLPAWARNAAAGNKGVFELAGKAFDLTVGHSMVEIGGRSGHAVTINGTLPGPLLRFREGEKLTLRVKNTLNEETSIHWHGLLVPFHMDGVPGVSFPGIKAGETFVYEFALPQNGTYWYHSHSGLQEQMGHYGPIIIDPACADPIQSDREYVLVLSDWAFEHPHKVMAKLKKNNEVYNFQQRTAVDFVKDAGRMGLGSAIADRAMWGQMRMTPTDIADVTGAVYTYLINGHATADNWTAIFNTGERVRLRIINASAMTIFNFRIPGLPMTVVQTDGQNVQPVETDEFQIGVAETYDVIVAPTKARAYAIVAESIDRSGQAVATLAPEAGLVATAPLLRERPLLTHKDMGMAMNHGSMGHGSMGGGEMADMDHGAMPGMDDGERADTDQGSMAGMDHGSMPGMSEDAAMQEHKHERGPGVDNVAMVPTNRLNEPGLGLENVAHRTLRYSELRSLDRNPDTRAPEREFEIHLTGNMERFMWSFDGVKFSEVGAPVATLFEGERVRFTLVNDTMMTHPIHLHGHFFEVVNGGGEYNPRKHTIDVKPGEKLSFDFTGETGDWAFHCHLLFHMHAGMMQVVSVLPREGAPPRPDAPAKTCASEADAAAGHEGHGSKAKVKTPLKAKPKAKLKPEAPIDHDKMDPQMMDHGSMDHGSHQ
jgi:CopA family copper-resistance protein